MQTNNKLNKIYTPLVPFMPKNPKVGYGYVPYQINPKYMDVDEAFRKGTLFPDLVIDYNSYENRGV